MAKLYVTEYAGAGGNVTQGNVAKEPEITTQVVSFTGTAGVSSAFATNTSIIRVHPDGICSVLVSAAGTAATTANKRMNLGQTEYFEVPAGQSYKISAITNT